MSITNACMSRSCLKSILTSILRMPYRTKSDRPVKHAIATLCLAALVTACEKPVAKPTPAASVKPNVTEAQLNNVVLTPDAVRRLGIELGTIDSGDVRQTRTVGGEITVPPGQSLVVSAPVAGTILAPENGALPLAGSRVNAAQSLMRLVALPPDRDILRSSQDLATVAARLRQVEQEAARIASLYADKLVALREHERAQADLAVAKAAFEAAAAQQRLVDGAASGDSRGLGALTIKAPVAGVLRAMHVGAGQSVAAGMALAEVVRLDQLWVRVPLYAGDIASIVPGANATVQSLTDASATSTTTIATPVAAPPSASANAASVDLFYSVRGATFRPGERVNVVLNTKGASQRGLSVPISAVVRDMSGGSWVYTPTDSLTYSRRRVEIASVQGGRAILARGPAPGTRVVIAGAAELFGTEFGVGK